MDDDNNLFTSSRPIVGLVLACVFIPFGLAFIVLNHFRRASARQAEPSYWFFVLQEIGGVLCIGIYAAALISPPECILHVWSLLCAYPLFILPMILRLAVYCMRFSLTQKRSKTKQQTKVSPLDVVEDSSASKQNDVTAVTVNVDGDDARSPFLLRNTWLVSTRTIFLGWLFMFCIMIVVPIALAIQYRNRDTSCYPAGITSTVYLTTILWSGILFAIIVVSVFFLWRIKDAYHIKTKYKVLLVVWVACMVTMVVMSTKRSIWGFPWELAYAVPIFLSLVIMTIWIHILHKRKLTQHDIDLGIMLSDMPEFRDRFASFLCLQFCIENLQFWEEVQAYKRIPDGSAGQLPTATDIFNKYIKSGSNYEVNISDKARDETSSQIGNSGVTSRSFDSAEREVMSLMRFHSYPLYVLRYGSAEYELGQVMITEAGERP
eukprot:TRINITY_DN11098_c0_g2_i1.p1 TRINITY_DN11098_c0_g2~~TRINITY_DN11098_c0_g2_i1.p1  ORF type:complete len:433 (+),score=50.29 TRINITY_DN11098_c0_g2_i1:173-1471(+)